MLQIVQQGRCFHGLSPFGLKNSFATDRVAGPTLTEVELLHPWRWNFGERLFFVCAVKFRKKA